MGGLGTNQRTWKFIVYLLTAKNTVRTVPALYAVSSSTWGERIILFYSRLECLNAGEISEIELKTKVQIFCFISI